MNKTLGATLLVAGTIIGGGMLALPMACHSLGTLPALGWLMAVACLMYYAGLIHIEINLFYGHQASTISTLVSRSMGGVLGKSASKVASFLTAVLFYSLLAAYSVGGASLLHGILNHGIGWDLPLPVLTVGLILFFAALTASRMQWLDYVNRILFLLKTLLFAGLMGQLVPSVDPALWTQGQGTLNLTALAIFCTSFGFHVCVPRLLPYLDYNIKAIQKAFLGGTVVSLILYSAWALATLGIIPPQGILSFDSIHQQGNDLGAFLEALRHWTGFSSLTLWANGFSLIAVLTSFLGVGVGLFAFVEEHVYSWQRKSLSQKQGKRISLFLTYSIPLVFGLFYPQGFVLALEYAGIAAALLSVTFPALVALSQRRKGGGVKTRYGTPGGYVGISLALLASLLMIGVEFIR